MEPVNYQLSIIHNLISEACYLTTRLPIINQSVLFFRNYCNESRRSHNAPVITQPQINSFS
jgi:hypothetical protein